LITARNRQRGFGIAAAIFILLVLAVLAAFIVSVSTTQHAGAALDVQGTETYRSARSGIEWGVYNVLKPVTSCSPSTDIGAVSGMQVTVECNQVPPVQTNEQKAGGVGTAEIYEVAATACNLPSAGTPKCPGDIANPHYVERRINVVVEK
jgi:MSHA biogenesis protein MshP